ncbi:MAG: SDR family oxidoreductase [Gemmataceae bacterium]
MRLARSSAIAVTGATGYLGSLIAAGLLAEGRRRLVLPVRPHHAAEGVIARLAKEVAASGKHLPDLAERITVLPLPTTDEIPALADTFRRLGVEEIVHAAGCVDYFHTENLARGNVELTDAFVKLSQELHARRFTFISSAFSSGFRDGPIPEALHADADEDPTEYTRSKREAEALVAGGGVPYLIVRPSVVIGDSRDGRYGGKRYGVYQLWYAADRLMCTDYLPAIYAIAPRLPMPLLHQDAFRAGFLAAYRALPANSVFHLVSRDETLPTVRDLWDLWLHHVARPRQIHYFQRLADVPLEKLSRNQRVWVELTGVNLDISSRPWRFESGHLDRLRRQGLHFTDVTTHTISVCQDRFISDSPRVRGFMEKYRAERAAPPRVVECDAAEAVA